MLLHELADLLNEHLRIRSAYYLIGRDTWLFPVPTATPTSPWPHLGGCLRSLGIYARAARGAAALLDLATQLPAVLAELLGISTKGADRWVSRTGNSWANPAIPCTNLIGARRREHRTSSARLTRSRSDTHPKPELGIALPPARVRRC
ncbi:hypothetical protein GCM10027569_22180 [Flindersiella endophytica]